MKTVTGVEIKSKGELLATLDYEEPENLQEGIQVDGEDKVFKLYLQKRKSNWMDAERKERTGGSISREILDTIKNLNPDEKEQLKAVLAKLKTQSGVELDIDDEEEEEEYED